MREERYRVFVPWEFFRSAVFQTPRSPTGGMYPCNAELCRGNALRFRAIAAKVDDGSLLQSREYLLFGNGLATLLLQASRLPKFGYYMTFVRRHDRRGVEYWLVQSDPNQEPEASHWRLKVLDDPPDLDVEGQVRVLIFAEGSPSQYFYLARM